MHTKTKSGRAGLVAAAVAGLVAGGMLTGCSAKSESGSGAGGTPPAAKSGTEKAVAEKHACKGMNSCTGKGGCKSGDAGCAAKNTCKGKGGCATVAKHGCSGKNECKAQGGCKSSDNGCAGKNTCQGKGGCAVPVVH